MSTAVHVAGTPFSARTPSAVKDTTEVFLPDGSALDGFWDEVRCQRGDGWVHVQWDQEEQRRASSHGCHGEKRRRVEPYPLLAGSLRRFLLRLSQLQEFSLPEFLLLIQEMLRATAPHGRIPLW